MKYKDIIGYEGLYKVNNNGDVIGLPYFKDKRMYKGMELDEPYTLEKLGL